MAVNRKYPNTLIDSVTLERAGTCPEFELLKGERFIFGYRTSDHNTTMSLEARCCSCNRFLKLDESYYTIYLSNYGDVCMTSRDTDLSFIINTVPKLRVSKRQLKFGPRPELVDMLKEVIPKMDYVSFNAFAEMINYFRPRE